MGSLSSLLTKKQDKDMNEEIENQEDTEKHLLDKLPIGAVMLRNFLLTSPHIENIDGGRAAYIYAYGDWVKHFNKSRSTFYRWIKQLESDEMFWYDKNCSCLLFYYAT